MLDEILRREFYHNRVSEYLVCLALIAAGVFVVRVAQGLGLRRLRTLVGKTPFTFDDFLVDQIPRTGIPLAYLGIVEAALRSLKLTPRVERILDTGGIILLTLIAVRFAVSLLRYAFADHLRKRGEDSSRDRALKGVVNLVTVLVWVTGGLFMLDNLGFRISTMVAGLGIGGVAVALASQNILGDLFAYFIILFDRPFEVGDFVTVGDFMGVVDRLGLKTTRLAGLGGEQIIMSNKDLTDSRVRNYKRMARRRVVFRIGVTYRTPPERLREIPGIVRDIFGEVEGTTLDRVHFFAYGDFSLIHEAVYYVEGNDYTKYMDIQQKVNLRIYEEFEKRRIEFAYPTQTLYLARG